MRYKWKRDIQEREIKKKNYKEETYGKKGTIQNI